MIEKCKVCKGIIGYGLNEVLKGEDTTKIKPSIHILKTQKLDGLCDECYNKKVKA